MILPQVFHEHNNMYQPLGSFSPHTFFLVEVDFRVQSSSVVYTPITLLTELPLPIGFAESSGYRL